MDLVEGARMLADRLQKRNRDAVDPTADSVPSTAGALPVFGWLTGEAPAVAVPGTPAPAVEPPAQL